MKRIWLPVKDYEGLYEVSRIMKDCTRSATLARLRALRGLIVEDAKLKKNC